MSQGSFSLVGEADSVPITILRDTGAKQTIIREGVLPFSADSYCGSDILVWGVKMNAVRAPLYLVQLASRIKSGKFKIAVRPQLPTAGIELILANDVAGGKVFPSLVVTDDPTSTVCISPAALDSPPLFPVCAVTRAQARKYAECVDLSDSFLSNSAQTSTAPENSIVECSVPVELGPNDESLKMSVDREHLIREQKTDPTLTSCLSRVNQQTPDKSVFYFLDDGVLMRCWSPSFTHESVRQIVAPQLFRLQVLTLAHDHCLFGHLGISKTYQRILRYFFWPGLKSDVVKFCRSCHTFQVSGKPNQKIPAAPLHPIPVVGEPFEHIIVDCVGPSLSTSTSSR